MYLPCVAIIHGYFLVSKLFQKNIHEGEKLYFWKTKPKLIAMGVDFIIKKIAT